MHSSPRFLQRFLQQTPEIVRYRNTVPTIRSRARSGIRISIDGSDIAIAISIFIFIFVFATTTITLTISIIPIHIIIAPGPASTTSDVLPIVLGPVFLLAPGMCMACVADRRQWHAAAARPTLKDSLAPGTGAGIRSGCN